MKKQLAFILIAVCLGLFLTWGALHVSASQDQPSTPVTSPVTTRVDREQINNPGCLKHHQNIQAYTEECFNLLEKQNNRSIQEIGILEDNNKASDSVIRYEDGRVKEKGTNLHNLESYTLSVYVENANGQPAENAYLRTYKSNGQYMGYAYTDVTGYAYLDISAGIYDITSSSSSSDDQFFLYQRNVSAPGSVTLSAVGTTEVTLTAKKKDGSPLNAGIYVGISDGDRWMNGWAGQVGSSGQSVFHIISGVYDVGLIDWTNHYVVYAIDQDWINSTGLVSFDMSILPSAEVSANHIYDGVSHVGIHPNEGNLAGFGWSDIPNGTHFVLSPNLQYQVYQELLREDIDGLYWSYLFYPDGYIFSLMPGEIYEFSVGGTMSVQGRTEPASPGEWITLTSETVDEYGSFLSYIYTATEEYGQSWNIYPQIQLTDPNGTVTTSTSLWYQMPTTAPVGIYDVHFEWNTGPYQGILTADSQFEVLPFSGLRVYVETVDGQPASDAYVGAFANDNSYYGYGFTGADGYAALDLPAGTYNIYTYSEDDHFLIYQASVPSQGDITLSAVDSSEVTITATKKDGLPMDQAEVYVGVSNGWAVGSLGIVDSTGQMVFHVTPNIYDVEVLDYVNNYALYKVEQDFTGPVNTVDFDMSTEPGAELVAGHPNDTLSSLYLCPDAHLYCFLNTSSPDGARITVSPGLGYYPYLIIRRDDTQGNHWNYEFEMDLNDYTFFTPGEVLTFTVGGELSVNGRTEDAYIGDSVLLADTVDSFGSFLTFIYTYTPDYNDYSPVYPEILLTDPNGHEITLGNWWTYFSVYSPIGIYNIHTEWNTGEPYQGLITTDSQFELLPQESSAIIPPEGGEFCVSWDNTCYEFASGTFTDTVIITHTVRYTDIPDYAPMLGIGHFYDVTAVYSTTGMPAQPTQPYTITIGYTDWQRGVVIEESMGLFNWDSSAWMLDQTSTIDASSNLLVATPDHFSSWGILGETNRIFLTILNRK